MSTDEYVIADESLFDFTAGVYCGVLMPEDVMKKLSKLQAKYLQDVKRLLIENKDRLHPSSWSLYYPDGKQTSFKYIDTSYHIDIEDRIKHATMSHQPKHEPVVFIANGHEDAERMANAHFEVTGTTAA
ncbi:hypothetical protein [Enterobacter ludwigii]|uniref:hypothetical protein n=1 Tax=Enterobacter ludwigii TaxID=299767 RepID=UPI001EF8BC49|nr:hypothetical protein [Enterobacter ludwigii]